MKCSLKMIRKRVSYYEAEQLVISETLALTLIMQTKLTLCLLEKRSGVKEEKLIPKPRIMSGQTIFLVLEIM